MRITQEQMLFISRFTDNGIGATFTLTDGFELIHMSRIDGQHVAFLSFIAPNFHRRHARLVIRHGTQLETPATTGIMHQFRQCIGEPAGTDIVNKQNRVLNTSGPAAVDHLLTATLHLRVGALNRGKIEILGRRSTGHG